MKSHFLSQLSGICSGIAAMSPCIDSSPICWIIFISSTILSFILIAWSESEQKSGN